MTREVVEAIGRTVGRQPAETGGALGGVYEGGAVSTFVFDAEARRSGATYSPNSAFLNTLFKEDWNPRGVRLLGFVHSHPRACRRPSRPDEEYAARILAAIPEMPHLLLPLVMSAGDGGDFEIIPFVAYRDEHDGVRIEQSKLRIVESTDVLMPVSPEAEALVYHDHLPDLEVSTEALFMRVRDAYDLDQMARSRVVFIGAGGARAFAGDLVRAGVMEIVLVDGDKVSATNVGTQHVYHDEIGRSKVECVADELRRIHPNVRVRTVARMLDDDTDDAALERIVAEPFEGHNAPDQILLCGFTDSFQAQARLHRFALTTGRPYLSGQVYREGRGIELVFTHPETTPACARCATRRRYEAYERGYQNNVGSVGTPVSSTVQVNAMRGYLALALLHHGTSHPRWGGLLSRIGDRNLVMMRLDPDFGETIGVGTFDDALGGDERFLFGEAIWRRQKPDRPENGFSTCPECGGHGDLRKAVGSIPDTRPTMNYGLDAPPARRRRRGFQRLGRLVERLTNWWAAMRRRRARRPLRAETVMFEHQCASGSRFVFAAEREDDGELALIVLEQPAYGLRNRSVMRTHRYLRDGYWHVDWNPSPRSVDMARQVAAYWADATDRYVRTGETIDEQVSGARRASVG